jgi:hypothetical protein
VVEISKLLSDDEAAIWIREYGQKHTNQSKTEALQIGYGFRKSRRAVGLADRIKIHAEFVDNTTNDRYLVSWLPVPLFESVNKNVSEQREVIDRFKAEAGLPTSYDVSFGSADHITSMALEHMNATQQDDRWIDPFNGLIIVTDSLRYDERIYLKCYNRKINRFGWRQVFDVDPFIGAAAFVVGVVKALPIAELIPEGYKFDQDMPKHKFEMNELEFIPVLENGENPIRGPEIYNRAIVDKADFGYADARHILARSEEIPANIKSVIFPGARLKDKTCEIDVRKGLVTPYIHRQDDKNRPDFGAWCLSFLQFNSPCNMEDRFVRLKQNEETNKGEIL